MKQCPLSPVNYRRHEGGGILIEFAVVVPILILILFGLVEVANFMRYKEKMTRTASDITELLATMPYWYDANGTPAALVGESMDMAATISAPYGVQLTVQFCPASGGGALTGGQTSFSQTYAATIADSACTPSGGAAVACNPALVGGVSGTTSLPYVVVSASCSYSGPFQRFVPDIVIQEIRGSPMRYVRSLL